MLSKDFSQYLHVPTLTDPQPGAGRTPRRLYAGARAAQRQRPGLGLWKGRSSWSASSTFLEERGYIPTCRERLTHSEYITPDYFEGTLDAYLGNAFGPEPTLIQSAYFRPHNRSEDIGTCIWWAQARNPAQAPPAS